MLGSSSLPDDPNVDWDTKIASQIIADHIKHNQFQVVRWSGMYRKVGEGVGGRDAALHWNHCDWSNYFDSKIVLLKKYITLYIFWCSKQVISLQRVLRETISFPQSFHSLLWKCSCQQSPWEVVWFLTVFLTLLYDWFWLSFYSS